MAAPVTKSDAELARKTAMPAMSSIVPQRLAGVRRSTFSLRPGTSRLASAVRSVSIHPGRTALTWMLSAAQAVAIDFVSCTMPPFDAAYAGANEAPKIDIIEPMLITLPPPACDISGYAACEQRNAEVRLVSSTR